MFAFLHFFVPRWWSCTKDGRGSGWGKKKEGAVVLLLQTFNVRRNNLTCFSSTSAGVGGGHTLKRGREIVEREGEVGVAFILTDVYRVFLYLHYRRQLKSFR